MADCINNMNLVNSYSRPKIIYIFNEDYYYMNESEKDKIECENALIELKNCTIHFINLNKIEGLEESNNAYDYINSIVYTAFTPVNNLENEQNISITSSRDMLLRHRPQKLKKCSKSIF